MSFTELSLLMKYAKEYGYGRIRKWDISDTEHTICVFLFGHAGSSQDEVSSALKVDKTTVAKALSTLEQKGYVRRTPNPCNRRKNQLFLTDSGRESISEVVDIYRNWYDGVTSVLSEQEQAAFEDMCTRLLASAVALEQKGSKKQSGGNEA